MSNGPVRRVPQQDKQLVRNLIEQCLHLYMNQKEVVETLLDQAEIEPGFTEHVWQKLEEENQEFFEAYYLRLMVKHQIIEYNKLLEQQVQLMRQMHPTGVSSISTSNGSDIPPMPQNSACYPLENTGVTGPSLKQEDLHHPIAPSLPNAFTNGDAPPTMLSSQSSNVGLMQGINGGIVKSEPGFAGSMPYMFGADGNVLEAHPPFGDASVAVASSSSVGSSSQPLNELLLDANIYSFGFLDILESYDRSPFLETDNENFFDSHEREHQDILESYDRSPFLETDNENFFDSHEREHQGDNRRLDTIQESLSFEDNGQ